MLQICSENIRYHFMIRKLGKLFQLIKRRTILPSSSECFDYFWKLSTILFGISSCSRSSSLKPWTRLLRNKFSSVSSVFGSCFQLSAINVRIRCTFCRQVFDLSWNARQGPIFLQNKLKRFPNLELNCNKTCSIDFTNSPGRCTDPVKYPSLKTSQLVTATSLRTKQLNENTNFWLIVEFHFITHLELWKSGKHFVLWAFVAVLSLQSFTHSENSFKILFTSSTLYQVHDRRFVTSGSQFHWALSFKIWWIRFEAFHSNSEMTIEE